MEKKRIIKSLEDLNHSRFNSERTRPKFNPIELFMRYVSTKEIVHSKILGIFLNPEAEHGIKDRFLSQLLHKIGLFYKKIEQINVDIEYTLKGGPWDNRRIDILLQLIVDGVPKAIIIENKLNDAGYQPRQLADYRAALEQRYSAQNVIVICLPLHYGVKPEGADHVLYPEEISKLLEASLSEAHTLQEPYIQAYIRYLQNLHISNQIMDNARILANESEISDKNFEIYKAIVSAFNKLPNAYAERLLVFLKAISTEMNIENPELEEDYPNYVSVWTKKIYSDERGFWLSIGFDNNYVYFYIVSYNDIPNSTKLQLLLSSSSKDKKWYRFQEDSDFKIKFSNRPDYTKIIEYIKKFLIRFDTIL